MFSGRDGTIERQRFFCHAIVALGMVRRTWRSSLQKKKIFSQESVAFANTEYRDFGVEPPD